MIIKATLLDIAGTLVRSLSPRMSAGFFRKRASIIFYHGIWPRGSPLAVLFSGYDIGRFCDDMRCLSRTFRFVALEDLLQLNACGTPPDSPLMALGFDDGHDLIQTGVLDVLDGFGIRASVFVMVDSVGNRNLMWMHALHAVLVERGPERFIDAYNATVRHRQLGPKIRDASALPYACLGWPMAEKDAIVHEIWRSVGMSPLEDFMQEYRPYMDWDDLQTWIARGHSVGLHTRTHPFCSELSEPEIEHEIVDAACELRTRLDLGLIPFAYPFGDRLRSEAAEADVAERAGFSCMLGIGGVSRLGTPNWRLERMVAEKGITREVYGRPMVRSLMGRACRPPHRSPSIGIRQPTRT